MFQKKTTRDLAFSSDTSLKGEHLKALCTFQENHRTHKINKAESSYSSTQVTFMQPARDQWNTLGIEVIISLSAEPPQISFIEHLLCHISDLLVPQKKTATMHKSNAAFSVAVTKDSWRVEMQMLTLHQSVGSRPYWFTDCPTYSASEAECSLPVFAFVQKRFQWWRIWGPVKHSQWRLCCWAKTTKTPSLVWSTLLLTFPFRILCRSIAFLWRLRWHHSVIILHHPCLCVVYCPDEIWFES